MAHLLKQLEVNGFKSFAQKTTLDFTHGVTAIVGPNGSGKSNVIDAIRWLLGERDAKNLRGAKAEDLIFAGTAQRPRMGLASASLYFDNSSKFFPVDFEEVVITRQVTRDGENTYFLNKSEVRLKDLVDFLAQARLGARGLVTVTQGNSDMFIRATPRGRREMIEELLGLREYQLKKSEAERRLKNTQINLDKVKALIEEILPHLRSLRRQTSRFEKRESLELELKELENMYFGTEARDLTLRLAEIEQAIAHHGESHVRLVQARESAEVKLREVEKAQPEERAELKELKEQTQKLLAERSRVERELSRLEAQLEVMVTHHQAEVRLPAKEAQELLEKIKSDLEAVLESDVAHLLATVKKVLSHIREALHSSPAPKPQNDTSGLKERFHTLQTELQEMEKTLSDLKSREQKLELSQEAFYQSFKSAVADLENAKDAFEKWEAEHREKSFAKERLTLRKDEWERRVREAGRSPQDFLDIPKDKPLELSNPQEVERRIFRLRGDLASIGEIDESLLKEARETEVRYEFLEKELADLEKAKTDLYALIADLKQKIGSEFKVALQKINKEFNTFFGVMFGGGEAHMRLADPPKPKMKAEGEEESSTPQPTEGTSEEGETESEEGIELDLKLPRKRITSLDVLSGGERSLVGIAALFSLISVSPPPFLVLDEVDAPLDERNARRFSEMLKEFAKHTQFILVTHNRATMEVAEMLYGVTLGEDGASKIVALKLENV